MIRRGHGVATGIPLGPPAVNSSTRPGVALPPVISAKAKATVIGVMAAMVLSIQPWTPAAAADPPRFVCAGRLLGSDGRTDLGELERAAATRWDLSREDAIVLLERREVEWTADRRRIETVYRAVRIAADDAVEGYADLRIAYDSLRTELKVITLRTYRDGHWIESGPTAQVEMTPSALDRAPDLSGIRERMLLHDGVGLPCIVETAWRVTDLWPFRGGTEGVFVFAQQDPVVRAELFFTAPAGIGLFETGGGAPSPYSEQGEVGGAERRAVRVEFLEAEGTVSVDPAAYQPHASWSTWADWASYGAFLRDGFERAIGLDGALRDSVRTRAADEPTPAEKARSLAAFIGRRVRLVESDEALLRPRPRGAARVHVTGYGSAFDRAALAAALFREGGIEAEPLYRSRGCSEVDEGIPTLGRMLQLTLILREPPIRCAGCPGLRHSSASMTPPRARSTSVPRLFWGGLFGCRGAMGGPCCAAERTEASTVFGLASTWLRPRMIPPGRARDSWRPMAASRLTARWSGWETRRRDGVRRSPGRYSVARR